MAVLVILTLGIFVPSTCPNCKVNYTCIPKVVAQEQNDISKPDYYAPWNGIVPNNSTYDPNNVTSTPVLNPNPLPPFQKPRPLPEPDPQQLPIPAPLPVPIIANNNTTYDNHTLHIRIAVGGAPSSFNAVTLAWYRSQGVSEIHVVSEDLNPYPELAALIRAYGMIPVYDPEHSLWVDSGSQDLNFDYYRPQLYNIQQSHWLAFASEGLRSSQVAVLNEYLPFVSYFGDRGDNLYRMPYYSHPLDSHYANYPEFYYSWYYDSYINTMVDACHATPQHSGMTLGLWSSADLSRNPASIDSALRSLNHNNVNLNGFTFLLWGGTYDPMLKLRVDPWGYGGEFSSTLQYIQSLNGKPYTAPTS